MKCIITGCPTDAEFPFSVCKEHLKVSTGKVRRVSACYSKHEFSLHCGHE